ncbi:unnamed protein product, partial [Ilex paraguariensis]
MRLKPSSGQEHRVPVHRRKLPSTTFLSFRAGKITGQMLPDSSTSATATTTILLRRAFICLVFVATMSLSCFILIRGSESIGLRIPNSFGTSSRLHLVPSAVDDFPQSRVSGPTYA